MDKLDQIAQLLKSAEHGVAFTGAGISTESGIPDFRSPDGVWSRNRPVMFDDFVRYRAERVRYWKMRRALYHEFQNARPNIGHDALVRLEANGRIEAVITQNIDGLHQDAGSRRVLELHGTNRAIACLHCGKEWPYDEVLSRIDAGDEAPDCGHCDGPLKSRTISFGQAMPSDVMAEAADLSSNADVFLALGSSLVVEPAASLPRLAKSHGAKLIIINLEPTPLDDIADIVVSATIGASMQAVVEIIEGAKSDDAVS